MMVMDVFTSTKKSTSPLPCASAFNIIDNWSLRQKMLFFLLCLILGHMSYMKCLYTLSSMLKYAGVNQPCDGKYSIFFVNAPMNETRVLQFQ